MSKSLQDDVRYIRERVDAIDDKVSDVRERVAKVEVWAGLWGALAGIVTSLLAAIGIYLKDR